ncbi:Uncharacterised protein [uncultured Clostridium sp.]|nr:Uncharacterised protein [uncultured Clostridium sp.]
MKELSLVEKYILCILDNKNYSALYKSKYYKSCIINACLWQLFTMSLIRFDINKKIILNKDFNDNIPYLKTIYDNINNYSYRTIQKIIDDYMFAYSNYSLYFIIDNLLSSLVSKKAINIKTKNRLFNEKIIYESSPEIINTIISKIKVEVLTDYHPSNEIIIFTLLLLKSNVLSNYFSNSEIKEIKSILSKDVKSNEIGLFIKDILIDKKLDIDNMALA